MLYSPWQGYVFNKYTWWVMALCAPSHHLFLGGVWLMVPKAALRSSSGWWEVGWQLLFTRSQPWLTWHLLKSSPQGRRAHLCWSSQTSPARAARWCGTRCWALPGRGNSSPRRRTSGGAGWWRPQLWECGLADKNEKVVCGSLVETLPGHQWDDGTREVWACY